MTYPPAKGEPILIPCEGSGAIGQVRDRLLGGGVLVMCPMCGILTVVESEVRAAMPQHERDDVLARLERGDFG